MQNLIMACKGGDLQAFDKLIDHYSHTVERFAFQIGVPYSEVPDVTQEVFIRIYRFISQFDGRSFTSWLYKITLNVARDHSRKRSSWLNKFTRLKSEHKQLFINTTENIEIQVLRDEEDQYLYECIDQLDEKYRIPIILHFFHDLTYFQICEITDSKLSTVKVRMMRGKKLLAEKMNEEQERGGINYG